ncbi:hypothetical protein H9Y04_43405 [Streptomyces sp. TRM66268-LWL]|uniref:Transcription regulator TrmB N-terminal domain-containing protein n=1 Tax=Streptomyces polyasparticus TaxID=2767826 RepID=A0ABR7SX57_9ACTN|nr:hypothetical protein [Streptomyces polyasparticus]MBC9719379.1 hypothetical protein [Streptomyces polyasparticus]
MSHTDNNEPDRTVRALRAVPDPQPLTGLTGIPAAIYTELAAVTGAATTAELALAAGISRSATGKALVTLEEHGLAVRTRGGHEGARRVPDRWRPAPAPADEPGTTADRADEGDDVPTGAELEPEPAIGPSAQGDTTVPPSAESTFTNSTPADPDSGVADTSAPGAPDSGSPQASPEAEVAGEKKRLAPGALRQLVIDHLTAHPTEAFTATRLSRVIGKSSGAIANSLVTLTGQGMAEQVSDRPRTYRLAAAVKQG